MLIPQFSIRWMLGLMTLCAVVFSIVGLAVRGSLWAQAVSIGIVSLVVLFLVYAALFALLWGFAQITAYRRRGETQEAPYSPPPVLQPAGAEEPLTPIILE